MTDWFRDYREETWRAIMGEQNEEESMMSIPDSEKYVASESDERTVNNTMRHQYRVLSEGEKAQMTLLKDIGLEFITAVSAAIPDTREGSLAKTKIEEAVMWAVKGLTK